MLDSSRILSSGEELEKVEGSVVTDALRRMVTQSIKMSFLQLVLERVQVGDHDLAAW